MSTIDPTTIAGTSQPTAKTASQQDAFGKDAFMKLLVEQMKNQSPDSKSDPNAMINQMTQFSILEQLQNQSANQQQQNAATLLGHSVSYLDDSGTSVDGVVDSVDYSGGVPTLTVAGQAGIEPSTVYQVR